MLFWASKHSLIVTQQRKKVKKRADQTTNVPSCVPPLCFLNWMATSVVHKLQELTLRRHQRCNSPAEGEMKPQQNPEPVSRIWPKLGLHPLGSGWVPFKMFWYWMSLFFFFFLDIQDVSKQFSTEQKYIAMTAQNFYFPFILEIQIKTKFVVFLSFATASLAQLLQLAFTWIHCREVEPHL